MRGNDGPYVFKNENVEKVNGEHFRNTIADYLVSELNVMFTEDMFFQQDGDTCHTAR